MADTIAIDSIELNSNLYLDGLNNASLVSVNTVRTVEGKAFSVTKPKVGGRPFTLGTLWRSGRPMGIFCQHQIDDIKDKEQAGESVIITYRDSVYTALITGTNFTSLHQTEPEGPNKKFTGTINFMEV